MDFDFSDEQRMLKDSVDRLIAERYTFEQRHTLLATADGWSRELWQNYAELGLLSLPFAEADGGLGGSAVDTMIVMEALGRALALEPYMATIVLAGGLLRSAASDVQRGELIPGICAGELLLAFAHHETQARFRLSDVATTAVRDGDAWRLDGHKRFVLHGDVADKLIVSARIAGQRCDRDGLALFLVDANAEGVSRRAYLTQDRLRAADIELANVRVANAAVLGEPGHALPHIERVVDTALAALCAEAVGAMSKAHELTVDYLKTRKQFGVTIGSFQALQHRAVDMLVMVEQARSMALFATMMADTDDATERAKAMSASKIQIGKSAKFVGQQAVQLHGGIGVTEECHAGHYFRRLSMIEVLFGDTDHHLAALAGSDGLIEAGN
jgi:pimeloyl-CoA dehydrogenase small subunit